MIGKFPVDERQLVGDRGGLCFHRVKMRLALRHARAQSCDPSHQGVTLEQKQTYLLRKLIGRRWVLCGLPEKRGRNGHFCPFIPLSLKSAPSDAQFEQLALEHAKFRQSLRAVETQHPISGFDSGTFCHENLGHEPALRVLQRLPVAGNLNAAGRDHGPRKCGRHRPEPETAEQNQKR